MSLFSHNHSNNDFDSQVFSVEEEVSVKPGDVPGKLVVLPLRNTVIFPETVVPVIVDRPISQKAVKKALDESNFMAVFSLKNKVKSRSKLSATNLNKVGTACFILKVVPIGQGSLMVALQGVSKIRNRRWENHGGLIRSSVEVIAESISHNKKTESLVKSLINVTQQIVSRSPFLPQETGVLLEQLEDSPLKLLYTISTLVKFKQKDQQRLLETEKGEDKLVLLIKIISQELEILKLGGKIQSSVAEEFNKVQREAVLRQKMRAIQKELGEDDPNATEIKEIRRRAKDKLFPDEVKDKLESELIRLENMSPMAAEYQVLRTYVDWIIDLPWNNYAESQVDLKKARKILDEDHYGLKEIKERLIEYLAVRKLKKDLKSPILCFVGPPGVGKTSLGKSIARALNRDFVRISLGGIHDEAEIRGHRRTYVGALPGRIIQTIKRAGTSNPVFMLDEIDKIGSDFRGDPSSALLEVLDPEQNVSFRDHYLDLDYDLSQVMFIATANVLDTLHPALLDRMEVIEIPGYTEEEKLNIAEKYLLPRQIEENGLELSQVKIDKKSLSKIISFYTREAGVRHLERQIAKILRKIAKTVAEGSKKTMSITPNNLEYFLGPQKVFPELKRRTAPCGVVTGLAVTSVGGEIIFIEAANMPGNKKITLTGNLGDVMKESASTALSVVRSRAKNLGIDKDFFEKNDLHLHVPSGAVPKDGPSAGIAMVISLISLLKNQPLSSDLAMTGEITLSGLVLPVGGIKQKILAARRAGIKKIILPYKNKGDLEEIETVLKKGLTFKLVKKIEEVIKFSFE